MNVSDEFSYARADETRDYGMDFVNDLNTTETIISAMVTMTLISGTDPALMSSHVSGAASVSGTVVSQRITGLVVGCRYNVEFVATTSNGTILSNDADLECAAFPTT